MLFHRYSRANLNEAFRSKTKLNTSVFLTKWNASTLFGDFWYTEQTNAKMRELLLITILYCVIKLLQMYYYSIVGHRASFSCESKVPVVSFAVAFLMGQRPIFIFQIEWTHGNVMPCSWRSGYPNMAFPCMLTILRNRLQHSFSYITGQRNSH